MNIEVLISGLIAIVIGLPVIILRPEATYIRDFMEKTERTEKEKRTLVLYAVCMGLLVGAIIYCIYSFILPLLTK